MYFRKRIDIVDFYDIILEKLKLKAKIIKEKKLRVVAEPEKSSHIQRRGMLWELMSCG